MLILTLKKLEANGFVARGHNDVPTAFRLYRLTPLAYSFIGHLKDLYFWMNKNAAAILQTRRSNEGRVAGSKPGKPKRDSR